METVGLMRTTSLKVQNEQEGILVNDMKRGCPLLSVLQSPYQHHTHRELGCEGYLERTVLRKLLRCRQRE